MTPDAIDFFAGPGGWDTGAALLGLRTVGVEKDADACATAEAAGHERIQADVTGLDLSRFAGVPGFIASPPCQAWSKAGKRLGLLDQPRLVVHVAAVRGAGEWIDYSRKGWHDDRSPLGLEPLRYVLTVRPTWVALEQVPDVLPFWELLVDVLREFGYRAWCGVLDSEMYGVPQTRDRAILTAALDDSHHVGRPPATHQRYQPGASTGPDLFGDLLPWVSMADALGWNGAAYRLAPTLDTNVGGKWRVRFGNQDHSAVRAVDEPAATIRYSERANACDWVMCSAGRTAPETSGQVPRDLEQPSATITGRGTAAWVTGRPATTVQGDPRIAEPGHRDREGGVSQFDGQSVRVSVEEAACLQSFPAGYPWQGSRTAQYRQIGDAVPPLLSVAVLGHLLGIDGWRDICRDAYRSERAA